MSAGQFIMPAGPVSMTAFSPRRWVARWLRPRGPRPDPTQTRPFYKVVIGANLATWFDASEPTATLTCIDAGLAEQCTTSAFYRLTGGGDESAQILAGMTMTKLCLSAARQQDLHHDIQRIFDAALGNEMQLVTLQNDQIRLHLFRLGKDDVDRCILRLVARGPAGI